MVFLSVEIVFRDIAANIVGFLIIHNFMTLFFAKKGGCGALYLFFTSISSNQFLIINC
jgi:hypothetical protein